MSSQITLAAPRLGADGGVGRTTKNGHEKPTVPCLCVATRLPKPWSRTEWGGRRDGRKADRRAKRDHPGPSTERGVDRTRKKTRTNQAAQPNHARDAPNPDIKIPNHQRNPRRKMKISDAGSTRNHPRGKRRCLDAEKVGSNPRSKLKSQYAEATRSNPRGRTQKSGKLSSAAVT